jgi:hypothetical protein
MCALAADVQMRRHLTSRDAETAAGHGSLPSQFWTWSGGCVNSKHREKLYISSKHTYWLEGPAQ